MLINSENFKKIQEKKTTHIKKFTTLEVDYDFNFLIKYIEDYSCRISLGGSYNSTWSAFAYWYPPPFNLIENFIRETFKYRVDPDDRDGCEMFYTFSSGSGPSHVDREDIFLLGLHGKTIYKVGDDYYTVEKGDLLFVAGGVMHKAIAVTPRIVASFGFFGGRNES